MREVVIASAVRTAIGTFGGALKDVPAADLGAIVIKEAVNRAGIKPYAWIINRSFALTNSSNNLLCQKALNEIKYINEVKENLSSKTLIKPWAID